MKLNMKKIIWKNVVIKKIRSRHLLSDSEDENQDDRSLLCVRDRDKM